MRRRPPHHHHLLGEGGNALVELALILPVLATLLGGLADFGLMAYDSLALNTAARAGAQYGLRQGGDSAGIQAAVRGATTLTPGGLTITLSYQCYDGSAVAYPTPCSASHQDAGQSRVYLTVTVSEPFPLLIPWPGLANPHTLVGTAVLPLVTTG